MTKWEKKTRSGYDFYECSSALQKSIRRNAPKMAGFFALELYHSGYWAYVWKRLMTVSAEDCDGIITQEIWSLFQGFLMVNDGHASYEKGRIFISKAVLMLCRCDKNRDPDVLQNVVYDKRVGTSIEEVNAFLNEVDSMKDVKVPEYTYDVHTRMGRMRGKTKEDFFRDEQEGLKPKSQLSLFDDIVTGV